MIDDVLKDATRRMDKSVENARHEFTTMRFVPLSEHGEWPEPMRLLRP